MALILLKDIRPLFRNDPVVSAMTEHGLDLSSYSDVKAKAQAIYATLLNGSMPCDGAWPTDRVTLFKEWMDEGTAP